MGHVKDVWQGDFRQKRLFSTINIDEAPIIGRMSYSTGIKKKTGTGRSLPEVSAGTETNILCMQPFIIALMPLLMVIKCSLRIRPWLRILDANTIKF